MSGLQKWYWNAAGMQASGQPDDRPFFEAAEVEAVLDTSMQRQETLAKNVNDGLLEIKALRGEHDTLLTASEVVRQENVKLRVENERLTRYSALTLSDLRAQVTALEQARDDLAEQLMQAADKHLANLDKLAASEARCKIYEEAFNELQNAILDAQHILDKEE